MIPEMRISGALDEIMHFPFRCSYSNRQVIKQISKLLKEVVEKEIAVAGFLQRGRAQVLPCRK